MEKVSKTNSVDSKLNGVEVNAEVGGWLFFFLRVLTLLICFIYAFSAISLFFNFKIVPFVLVLFVAFSAYDVAEKAKYKSRYTIGSAVSFSVMMILFWVYMAVLLWPNGLSAIPGMLAVNLSIPVVILLFIFNSKRAKLVFPVNERKWHIGDKVMLALFVIVMASSYFFV